MNILKWYKNKYYAERLKSLEQHLIARIHICNDLENQIRKLLDVQKEHEKQIAELQEALEKECLRSKCFRDQIISLRKEITEFTEVTRIIGNRIAGKL